MATKLKFYTSREIAHLKAIANYPTRQQKLVALKQFSEKFERSYNAAYIKYLTLTKRINKKTDKKLVNRLSVKKGQFKIPIESWNINNEDGKLYFTVNF